MSNKILIACESSAAVRDEFIARGFDAISCDILPTEKPGPHYQGDVRDILYDDWDMIIAFPPCTHIAIAGARFWKEKQADGRQQGAIDFFMLFVNHPCKKICIENPKGVISRDYRKNPWKNWAMQVIQPHWFGNKFTKTTCLWLKGLPPLMATKPMLDGGQEYVKTCNGKDRSKNRSRTFPGVADAMAEQWSKEL